MHRLPIAAGLAMVAVQSVISAQQPQPTPNPATLASVLKQLAAYVDQYAERLPATIATEHYTQIAVVNRTSTATTLESDFGIVRLPGIPEWLGFRDVLVVDGKPVPNREERLDALFRNMTTATSVQARRVAEESARYNIGPIQRTINNPALVLELLDARNARRMRFSKVGEDTIADRKVWVIHFKEVVHPTIVQASRRWDVPADGKAWVDPAEGTLLRVEAALQTQMPRGNFTASLSLTFREEPKLGFWVPDRLTEEYRSSNLVPIASGEANYSNYRQFTVDTRFEVRPR